MSETLPLIYLARHGETAWNLTGQHMGRIDMPLTQRGERNASRLGERLRGMTFAKVFTSPLQRASRTCELAGFKAAVVDPDLTEWDYGAYEGKTTEEILKERPGWAMRSPRHQRYCHALKFKIPSPDAMQCSPVDRGCFESAGCRQEVVIGYM